MNKAKKILIILAIVFSFIGLARPIYNIVNYFMTPVEIRNPVFYLVLYFITIAQLLTVAVLLILAIWGNGKNFRRRYGLYMSAIVLSMIINLFSVTSILLIATMFISDWVWIKPEKETVIDVVQKRNKAEEVAALKEKRERGEISEEEFQKQLFELL